MNFEQATLSIRRGDSIKVVQEKLAISASPDRLPEVEEVVYFYHLEFLGFWVFFKESGLAYSIRFENPYPYTIEGVSIGKTKEEVLAIRGSVFRNMPIPDGKTRWIYDQPQFLRIDFNKETGRVEKVFR